MKRGRSAAPFPCLPRAFHEPHICCFSAQFLCGFGVSANLRYTFWSLTVGTCKSPQISAILRATSATSAQTHVKIQARKVSYDRLRELREDCPTHWPGVIGVLTILQLLYSILYYTILSYPILSYTVLYHTILYYNILYYTMRLPRPRPAAAFRPARTIAAAEIFSSLRRDAAFHVEARRVVLLLVVVLSLLILLITGIISISIILLSIITIRTISIAEILSSLRRDAAFHVAARRR